MTSGDFVTCAGVLPACTCRVHERRRSRRAARGCVQRNSGRTGPGGGRRGGGAPAYAVLQTHVCALAHQEAANLSVVVARRHVKWRALLVVERVDADALLHCLDYQFRVAAAAGKVQLRLLPRGRWLLTHIVGVVSPPAKLGPRMMARKLPVNEL